MNTFSQNFLGEDPQTPQLGSSKFPIIASQLVKGQVHKKWPLAALGVTVRVIKSRSTASAQLVDTQTNILD